MIRKISLLFAVVLGLTFVSSLMMPKFVFAQSVNLIPNASIEQSIKSKNIFLPVGWIKGGYGSNSATYNYPVPGVNNSKAAKVVITKYTNGDRRWYFKEINVKPNTKYYFSNYYKSNINSEINVKYTLSNKKSVYISLLDLPSSQNQWSKADVSFTTPSNVKTLTVYQLIEKKGEITVDDFVLSEQPVSNGSTTTVSSSGSSSGSSSSGSSSNSSSQNPTQAPTASPTPIVVSTELPTQQPTVSPTILPTPSPVPTPSPTTPSISTASPTPIVVSTELPTQQPTVSPTILPTPVETLIPTILPSSTSSPTPTATVSATVVPTLTPTQLPSLTPTSIPTAVSTATPIPTVEPTTLPTTTPLPNNSGLILNGSVENASTDGLNPLNWSKGGWGTNTAVHSYSSESQNGNKGIKVEISAYTDGDAKWYFDDVNVTAGNVYLYSEYYKSNIASNLTIQYKMLDGSYTYAWLADLPIASDWTKYSNTINIPLNAISMTVFHSIAGVGWLSTDNYSLNIAQSNKFDQGMISFNFDDGYLSVYQNALPILNAANYKSTQYIIAETLGGGFDGYVNAAQVLSMQAQGHEIGAHSNTHADLTLIPSQQLNEEVSGSKTALESIGVNLINSFAYPYGNYNSAVIQALVSAGYEVGRTAYPDGENYKDTNKYELKVVDVQYATPLDTVKLWIDQAISNKSWIIFMFHQIDNSADQYSTTPTRFQEIVSYAQSKGISVVTNKQGVGLMNP